MSIISSFSTYFDLISSIIFVSTPIKAAIAPIFKGTAFCINSPLNLNIFAASFNFIDLALTKAEYSPKEWPAVNLPTSDIFLPIKLSMTLTIAKDTAIKAG